MGRSATDEAPDLGLSTGPQDPTRAGADPAADQLFHLVYNDLRAAAGRLMSRERPDHTLGPTALVHEAYLRLVGRGAAAGAPDRGQFFAVATRAMFEILVDHARRRSAEKRGGQRRRMPLLDHWLDRFERRDLDVVALHEAIERLAAVHERQARVVAMRFLLGMTNAEVARELGVSVGTVEGDWRIARAWLRRELEGAGRQ